MICSIMCAVFCFGVCEIICYNLLNFCKKNYEISSFQVDEINISKDLISFLLATFFPFLSFLAGDLHYGLILLIFLMLFCIVFLTDTLQYNIALSFLGYKAYEVKNKSGLTYILFSKRNFDNKEQLNKVIRINKYMVLDYENK